MEITFAPIKIEMVEKFEKRLTTLAKNMRDMLDLVLDSQLEPMEDQARSEMMTKIGDILSDEGNKLTTLYVQMMNRISRECGDVAA